MKQKLGSVKKIVQVTLNDIFFFLFLITEELFLMKRKELVSFKIQSLIFISFFVIVFFTTGQKLRNNIIQCISN